jgi:prolyl-tRNA editing enzyme YbaK/EbsC (Cys-tRNA(Pro) deacylase)
MAPKPPVDTYVSAVVPGTSGRALGLADPVADALDTIEHHSFLIDPELADTDAFTAAYGWPPNHTANTIVVTGRRGERTVTAMCVVLASTKVDINNTVRKTLDMRKVSFTPMHEAVSATGMQSGSITPFGAPTDWRILIDAQVVTAGLIVLGGGRRDAKIVVNGSSLVLQRNVEIINNLALPR